MLRFVLLVPSKIFTASYTDWVHTVLGKQDIRYVVLSNVLSQVWVYYYYSIFTFLYLQESSSLFERIYASDYWELYEMK